MVAVASRATEPAPITVRAVRFDLSHTPLHWVPSDPQTTHTMNVLHVLLPPGERWFCDVFRRALPLITDEQLRAEARAFAGQEATHAKAHTAGLEHMAAHGIDLRRPVALADRMRVRGRRAVRRLPPGLRRLLLSAELGAIAAIEHFTAVLGSWIIESSGRLDEIGTDPAMIDLLRWHGAEEMEHRSVAFDVYEHLSGNYAWRVMSMAGAFVGLTVAWVVVTATIMRLDPADPERPSWRNFRQAGRDGRLPPFGDIVGSVPHYLRRDHHPSQVGSAQLAASYLATSPGVVRRGERAAR